MSILIPPDNVEYDLLKRLEILAVSDNLDDFTAILRFINNSRCHNYRDIPSYILESNSLRIRYGDKYIRLLEDYSNIS